MGVYIKGKPSEGIYRLTYQETSDKGMVAILEGDGIAFIGQIVKAPHGRLIDAEAFKTWVDEYISAFHKSEKHEVKDYIEHIESAIEAEVE